MEDSGISRAKVAEWRKLSLLERIAYKLLRLQSGRHRAFTELFVPPYDKWVPFQSGLGDSVHVLYALARALQPKVIVEVGSSRGRSTCALALACAHNGVGVVHSIDPHIHNEWSDLAVGSTTESFLRDRLRDYELNSHCKVWVGTSAEVAQGWDLPIDLLFIDGDHSYAGVKNDFDTFSRYLAPNGLVLFHDSAWEHEGPWERFRSEPFFRDDMGVPRFLSEKSDEGYRSITLGKVPGLTILDSTVGGFNFLAGRDKPNQA